MVCDACADQQLAVVEGAAPTAVAGYELVVGGNAHGEGGKALGNRQFARYYKQKYKPGDHRSSSAVSSVIASYATRPLSYTEALLSACKLTACSHSCTTRHQIWPTRILNESKRVPFRLVFFRVGAKWAILGPERPRLASRNAFRSDSPSRVVQLCL